MIKITTTDESEDTLITMEGMSRVLQEIADSATDAVQSMNVKYMTTVLCLIYYTTKAAIEEIQYP